MWRLLYWLVWVYSMRRRLRLLAALLVVVVLTTVAASLCLLALALQRLT